MNSPRHEFTLIIQGQCTEECLDLQLKNYKNYNIIYSLWQDSPFNIPESDSVKIIKSPLPKATGHQNFFLQVISTSIALERVQTQFCIKMRADEFIGNLDKVIHDVVLKPDLLHTLNVFFRAFNHYAFHCSDHLIAGKTKNLKKMFVPCYDKIYHSNFDPNVYSVFPEINLTRTYLETRENQSIEGKRELMKQYFNIIDVNSLKPYIISSNKAYRGVKFRDNFDPVRYQSINDLDNY